MFPDGDLESGNVAPLRRTLSSGAVGMDIFRVYKAAKQRLARHEYNDYHEEMCDLAREMSKRQLQGTISHSELLILAEEFAALENACGVGIGRYYGPRLITAIRDGAFTNEIPYPVRHKWLESEEHIGSIYIAISRYKPGECKLGATTMSLVKRLQKFELKYGYPVAEYWSTTVRRPFYLEKLISDAIRDKKSAGVTADDSIEWFHIDAIKLRTLIIEIIAKERLHP